MVLSYLNKAELYELKGMIADLEEELGSTTEDIACLKLQLSRVEEKLQ